MKYLHEWPDVRLGKGFFGDLDMMLYHWKDTKSKIALEFSHLQPSYSLKVILENNTILG